MKKAKAAEMPPVDLTGMRNLYVRVPDGRWALVWQIFSEDELKRILESHRRVDGIFFDVKR